MTKYVLEDGDGERIGGYILVGGPVYNQRERAVAMQTWCESHSQFTNPVTVETVEQDDETTEDDNDTMSYDDIISTGDEESDNQQSGDNYNTVGNMWTLGDHSTASDDERNRLGVSIRNTMAELDDNVDDELKAVLQDAAGLVEDTSVSRFECPVEACGLGHSHPDHKHDIRSGFNVESAFADNMMFCPYCHCGVNELAMLIQFFPYINRTVFTDQEQFSGVLEVEPDVLEEVYREYDNGASLSRAVANVAVSRGQDESEVMPLGIREDVQAFFRRREDIQNAANSAPIAQETRRVIEEDREKLEEMTSA